MKTVQLDKNSARKKMISRGAGNVFTDVGFSPHEANDLKVKATLTLQIHQRIKQLGLTQVRAAERLGVSQPDISKLMNGRHTGYSVERLLSLLNALDVDIDIVMRPKRQSRRGVVRVLEAAGA